jgi:hypothetical protein
MDTSELPEPLRARMAQMDARTPLEKVASLLRGHVADTDGIDEVREELRMTAAHSTRPLRQALLAIDAVLAEELPPGTLVRLVAGEGGRPLDDDPTDAGAAAFLRELAGMVRAAVEEAEDIDD